LADLEFTLPSTLIPEISERLNPSLYHLLDNFREVFNLYFTGDIQG
jgi:hypothetical protein